MVSGSREGHGVEWRGGQRKLGRNGILVSNNTHQPRLKIRMKPPRTTLLMMLVQWVLSCCM